jgi:hypothetical protein
MRVRIPSTAPFIFILKKFMKEKKEFWELSFKYEELCRNISEHREFLKNFIDRKKFDRNIQKIAEFIFEEV